jgi:SAM-dependent methyltransferase
LIGSLHPGIGCLLDYGAGTGDFLSEAKQIGWQVYGIEPNDGARNLAGKKGIDLVAERSELGTKKFEVITLWHVLEHIHDLDSTLDYLYDHLADSGLLVIAVPNYRSWDAQHYGSDWAAYDVPRHLWHFSKNSMEVLFKDGLELIDIRPMKLDAFYVSLLSERYRKNKFGWPAAIWSGIRSNSYGRRHHEYSSHIYCYRKPKSDI